LRVLNEKNLRSIPDILESYGDHEIAEIFTGIGKYKEELGDKVAQRRIWAGVKA
jgi:hypothetical protein